MKNKKYWLLTSIVTLLPIVIGLLLWDRLPEQLPTHFGPDGAADGWSGKGFAVFGLPLLMLLFHGIIYACTLLDKRNQGHNRKVLDLVGLIFPAMSILVSVVIYRSGLGQELDMAGILFPTLGLLFVLMGNKLPKIKQNATLGIKLPWTLYNEENWNKTHRVCGYAWVLGGLVFCVMGFVSAGVLLWLLPVTVLALVGVPTVYSWNLARKQKAEGTYTESQLNRELKKHPVVQIMSLVMVVVILIAVGIVMFTGDIDYTLTETALVIEADYYDDLTVPYDAIDMAALREYAPEGTRQWGWGSAKLLLGTFANEEFGNHTRYSYAGCGAYVLLRSGDDVLILNAQDVTATRELYWALMEKLG